MASAIRAGRAFIEMFLDDDEARRQLNNFRRRLTRTAQSLQSLGTFGVGLGAAITAPFAAAIVAASDYEEALAKFGTVYGELTADQRAWVEDFAQQVGRAEGELISFASGFQDLLVPIGVDNQAAAETSRTLTALAVDLASFNNLNTADVARDLSAALTGSSEVMKKYGVVVNQTAVNQRLLNEGLNPNNATEAEKALARLNIILEGTTAAQGDAVRTSDGFANQVRRLQAEVQNAAVELGQVFLPAVTDLVQNVNAAVPAIRQWITDNEALVKALAAVGVGATAIGAVLLTLAAGYTAVSTAAGIAAASTGAFTAVIGALTSPLTIGAAGFTALTIGIAGFIDTLTGSTIIDSTVTSFTDLFNLVRDGQFAAAFRVLGTDIQIAINKILDSITNLINRIPGINVDNIVDFSGVVDELQVERELILVEAEREKQNRAIAEQKERQAEAARAEAQAEQQRLAAEARNQPQEVSSGTSGVFGALGQAFNNASGLGEFAENAGRFAVDLRAAGVSASEAIADRIQEAASQISLDGSPQQVSRSLVDAFASGQADDDSRTLEEIANEEQKHTNLLRDIRTAVRSGRGLVFGSG